MKKQLAILGAAAMIVLSGCGVSADKGSPSNNNNQPNHQEMNHEGMNHGDMNHSSSGEVPKGLKEAKNPAFKVGSQAIITADHMPGMKGATATIDSAEHTTVYMVDYTPTTGGETVKNHKWVTESELSTK